MKHCLRLSSVFLLLVLCSCGNFYSQLKPTTETNVASAMQYQPAFEKELYRGIIDGRFLLKKFHLSGILLFKKMEDSSTRVVFQNEMGISFFDFEWDRSDRFSVKQVIPQLDRPALIKTLQKDLQLLMMRGIDITTERNFQTSGALYQRYPLERGTVYYVSENGQLKRIENVGKKKVTTIFIGPKTTPTALPETVLIKHHKANFSIQLQKIDTHVDE